MGKENYSTEQIIVKLREAEGLCAKGKTVGETVCESFNSKTRDEFSNREIFDTMWETQVLTK